MGNTVAKKRADQEDVDSDHLFANFLQPPRSSPTREILRRSPPSCPGWNDASVIMASLLNSKRRHYAKYRAKNCAK
jgi:hypothetical protein